MLGKLAVYYWKRAICFFLGHRLEQSEHCKWYYCRRCGMGFTRAQIERMKRVL